MNIKKPDNVYRKDTHWLYLMLLMSAFFSPMLSAQAEIMTEICDGGFDTELPHMHSPDQALSFPIRLLNWNILKLKRDAWELDLQRFSYSANLVLLQESTNDERLQRHLEHLSFHSLAPGYVKGEQQTGVYTASTVRPVSSCYQQQMEPWLRSPKAVQISRYLLKDHHETLLVVNIHSINFAWGLTEYKQQLNAVEVALASHQGPVIMAGDFNTWSNKRLKVLQDFAAASLLEPVRFQYDQRTRFLSNALDHIFVRGLRVSVNHVWKTVASDHNPLFAELHLDNEFVLEP